LFGANLVRVCSDGGIVSSGITKFDKSAILSRVSKLDQDRLYDIDKRGIPFGGSRQSA
jgi:hypothetical protein